MTLTLRSAADAAAIETKIRNEARSARITILLFTRKGLRWTVYAGLLALRVRMRGGNCNSQLAGASGFCRRPSQGLLPVTGCDFLAYSCAAARELHPLPCLRHKAKTRKPKDISKNAKYVVSGIYRAAIVKVNRRPPPG